MTSVKLYGFHCCYIVLRHCFSSMCSTCGTLARIRTETNIVVCCQWHWGRRYFVLRCLLVVEVTDILFEMSQIYRYKLSLSSIFSSYFYFYFILFPLNKQRNIHVTLSISHFRQSSADWLLAVINYGLISWSCRRLMNSTFLFVYMLCYVVHCLIVQRFGETRLS